MSDDGRASWSDDKDATWLTEMIHQAHVLGKAANSGFKREAWIAALLKLNSTHNIKYNVQQLKARHAELKKQYSTVSQMVKTSGIGFESSTCRFVCTEGSWSHFLRDKPKNGRFGKPNDFHNILYAKRFMMAHWRRVNSLVLPLKMAWETITKPTKCKKTRVKGQIVLHLLYLPVKMTANMNMTTRQVNLVTFLKEDDQLPHILENHQKEHAIPWPQQ
ncbi:hypothetical protein Ae201684P_019803 [Aphanomyces euteiches]|nr:hypothetical protein Ae201684P_019803 [Aphanomyces euteiches]KAH9145439.1 hypothetical protein AeRB84_010665 [Aphanomyces euteiches]